MTHSSGITCCTLSANDQFLYTGSSDGTIIKWDTDRLSRQASFSRQVNFLGNILCLSLSLDNKALLFGTSKSILYKLNPDNLEIDNYLEFRDNFKGEITSIVITPDSQKAYIGSSDGKLFKVMVYAREIVHVANLHEGRINQMMVSPNGKTI